MPNNSVLKTVLRWFDKRIQKLEEDRLAKEESFRPVAFAAGQSPGPHRPAGAGGGPA